MYGSVTRYGPQSVASATWLKHKRARFSFPLGRECRRSYVESELSNEPCGSTSGTTRPLLKTETARRYGRAKKFAEAKRNYTAGKSIGTIWTEGEESILGGGSRGRSLRQSNWPKEFSFSLCPLAGFDNRRRLKGSYSSRREPGESLTSNCRYRSFPRSRIASGISLFTRQFVFTPFVLPIHSLRSFASEVKLFRSSACFQTDGLASNRRKDTATTILILATCCLFHKRLQKERGAIISKRAAIFH